MKVLILLAFIVATCYGAVEFSARARNFSIELLYFTQLETDGHVVISPYGIWSLMTGVVLGASGNSKTELLKAFILPENHNTIINGYNNLTKTVLTPNSNGVELSSKNFVFFDEAFEVKPTFQRTVKSDFGAKIIRLDFNDPNSAAKTANDLIQTSGASVSNVLRSEDFADSRMILTNIITFRGFWFSPFNTSETNLQTFYDENNREIGKVNMMYQRAELPFSNVREINSYVVELPYGNDQRYCMLVILPYPKIKTQDVYKKLSTFSLGDIFNKLQRDEDYFGLVNVDIKLPRFKISTNVALNKPLNHMGVYDIFDPKRANFEQITDKDIFVSAIVHKADIEVTESGTVASASTSAYFADRMSPPNFEANRPFIYFILEKTTTTIIFSGIYSKPSVF